MQSEIIDKRRQTTDFRGLEALEGLGDRVRECRLAAGLSVEQLAEVSALHHRTIERLEADGTKIGPTCLTIVCVSEALLSAGAKMATIKYLLTGRSRTPPLPSPSLRKRRG